MKLHKKSNSLAIPMSTIYIIYIHIDISNEVGTYYVLYYNIVGII